MTIEAVSEMLWSLAGPVMCNLGFSGCVGALAGVALKKVLGLGAGARAGAGGVGGTWGTPGLKLLEPVRRVGSPNSPLS